MSGLDKATFNEIVELLWRHLQSHDERSAFVTAAFQDNPALLKLIKYDGNARNFTIHLVDTCNKFGLTHNGQYATITLLETVREKVGQEEKEQIEQIIARLNTRPRLFSTQQSPKTSFAKVVLLILFGTGACLGILWFVSGNLGILAVINSTPSPPPTSTATATLLPSPTTTLTATSTSSPSPTLTSTATATSLPSPTATLTLTPTETPLPDPCATLPPPILRQSSFGIISMASRGVAVYESPSLNTGIIVQLQDFQSVWIVAEPDCINGNRWINVDYGGIRPAWIEDTQLVNGTNQYIVRPVDAVHGNATSQFFFGIERGIAASQPVEAYSAFQSYENGFMIWRSNPDEFYIFTNGGAMYLYNSTFVADMPDNNLNTQPPAGLILPVSGFGRIWNYSERMRSELGWATSAEIGYDATVQYVAIDSTPAEDKVLFYMALPTEIGNRVIAVGVGRNRYWRFANQ